MEQEAVYFEENGIIKSSFHKNKIPIKINEVGIERIKLSDKNHTVNIHLSALLDIGMKVILFHHHYV